MYIYTYVYIGIRFRAGLGAEPAPSKGRPELVEALINHDADPAAQAMAAIACCKAFGLK